MSPDLFSLLVTTITISLVHTASGPDHYLPFIVLSKARNWSLYKTAFWTVLCGLGHVLSSVLIGLLGVILGWQISRLDGFQEIRGSIASWGLLILGVFYLIWGLYKAYTNRPHKHFDVYEGDDIYVYTHKHGETVVPGKRIKVTPWILFAIFVMGPSEPIIPLLFYSGVSHSVYEIVWIITVFTFTTVLTMLVIVFLGLYGYSLLQTDFLERYSSAIGGAVVTLCAVGMIFFGW